MLGKLSRFANPEIEHLLKKLQADEESYDAELRSLDREKIVFPVNLITLDHEIVIESFSRSVSLEGLGLITPQPFSEGTKMNIEVQLHSGKFCCQSECRWGSQFGETFWSSGWQFEPGFELDFRMITDSEARVGFDARCTEREKYAIPVVIHQKGKLPRLNGFTRNMSGDGVNLVANQQVQVNSFCMLEFVRNGGERCDIIAECVWVKKYGESHWMTGWRFPRLERVAKFHSACFDR